MMKLAQAIDQIKELPWRKILPSVVLVIVFAILSYVIQSLVSGDNIDWIKCFRPGALALISGQNPHNLPGCHYMTWTLIPLIPIALLPPKVGSAILSTVAFFTFISVARHMGANTYAQIALILNPFFFWHYWTNPNVDWLVAIGYVVPPVLSFPLLLIKPQLGAGVGIYIAIEILRKDGVWILLKSISPALLLLVISTLTFGPYFLNFEQLRNVDWAFFSMWPESILIGAVLLVFAIRKSYKGMAILSSPFLFPYIGYYSWPWALLGLLPSLWVEIGVISLLLWIGWIVFTILNRTGGVASAGAQVYISQFNEGRFSLLNTCLLLLQPLVGIVGHVRDLETEAEETVKMHHWLNEIFGKKTVQPQEKNELVTKINLRMSVEEAKEYDFPGHIIHSVDEV